MTEKNFQNNTALFNYFNKINTSQSIYEYVIPQSNNFLQTFVLKGVVNFLFYRKLLKN